MAADDVTTYEDAGASLPRLLVRYVSAHAGRTEAQIAARYPGAGAAMDALHAEKQIVQVDLPGRRGAFVDRDVLLGLRRMTLSARRREVDPVSPPALVAAVLRRQHVVQPLAGSEGLRSVLEQLAGWLAPAAVWPELLEARLENPERIRIEPLVRGGFIEWRGWRLGTTRVLGFAPPDVADMVLPCREGELEGLAARVVEFLSAKGASFLHQIAGALESPPAAVDEALWGLTWRGWVTNDSLVAAQRAGPGRGRPTPGLGRWSVVAAARAGDREDDVGRILRVLLSRYGFLCRELVDRESIGLRWSEAYAALQRMEWRGDVERGVYVSGLSGPQFAVAGWHHVLQAGHEEGRLQLLHVMDPANLLGEVVPIARVPRRGPGNYVVVRGGRPLVAVEARARRLVPLADLSVGERREALSLLVRLVRRAGQRPSIRVEIWDGVPAAASEVAGDLAALGFIRDDQAMVLYRSFRGSA